ncbi:hypothetical protein JCM10207_005657 [Rhodosporidiobolus poonsookiae]
MAPRPRRSAASTASYSQFLAPIQLSESSSSSDSDDEAAQPEPSTSTGVSGAVQPKPPKSKKKKKFRRALYIPSEDSGSEFEAAKHSSSEDEEPDADAAATSASEDGAGTDASGSIVGGSPEPQRGIASQRRRGLQGRGGGAGRGRGRGRAPTVAVQHAPSDKAGAPTRQGAPRVKLPSTWPVSGWDIQYGSAGPLVTTLPMLALSGKGKGKEGGAVQIAQAKVKVVGNGEGAAKGAAQKGKGKADVPAGQVGMSDAAASELMEGWTANPYGPVRSLVRDLGWARGSWVAEEREDGEGFKYSEARKWGGWYDELEEKPVESVPYGELYRHLPHQLPNLHRPSERLTFSTEADDDADNQSEPESTPAPGPSSSMLPDPSGAAQAGSADGTVKLLLGRLTGKKGEVEREDKAEELPRFSSIRIDSYSPRKPGHLFNAGGPVNSVAWAPRARKTGGEGVRTEYLAVSTLSTLDAPLRHHTIPSTSPDLASLASSPAFNGHLPASSSRSRSAADADALPAPPLPGTLLQLWSLSLGSSNEDVAHELGVETDGPAAPADGEDAPMQDADAREGRGMRLELALCIDEGTLGDAWDLAWCPLGGSGAEAEEDGMDVDGAGQDRRRVGILAGVFRDGSIAMFEVPTPERAREEAGVAEGEVAFLRARPLVKLRLPNTSLFSLAWGSHETIAGGCGNGWIAVWDVGEVLRKGGMNEDAPPLRPTHFFPAHSSVIRSLCFVPAPSCSLSSPSAAKDYDLADQDPTGIISTGYDGSTLLNDLRQPAGMGGGAVLNHERAPGYAVAFCPHTGCAYIADQDDRVKSLYVKAGGIGGSKRIGVHRGSILSIATSSHHPFVLSTSTDGSAMVSTGMRALRKRRVRGHFSQKLFRVEKNRATGEIRVWDNLDIEHRTAIDPTNPVRTKGKQAPLPEEELHTPAWPLEQAVLKATWHPAIERAGLCATGWACGIGRVDWVENAE